jgi:hypothetical protein
MVAVFTPASYVGFAIPVKSTGFMKKVTSH